MSNTQVITGKDWAALVLHATCTNNAAAIGYSTYKVQTDDGVVEAKFLGFDADAKAVFKLDSIVASVGGEAFLQKLKLSGFEMNFGVDGKLAVGWDLASVSVEANMGGIGVIIGLKIGITIPGVKISIDFVQIFKDSRELLLDATHSFAQGWMMGLTGGQDTNFDRHIIILCQLDLNAAAKHHFGSDWVARNRDGTAYGWYATNGHQRYGFDGKYSLDQYVKDVTAGLHGNYGCRYFRQSNPHSWWIVQKFYGPPSLKCPKPGVCDGGMCKAKNDLSKFINAGPVLS